MRFRFMRAGLALTALATSLLGVAGSSARTFSRTPFYLGAYLGNPDGSDPAAEAQFESVFGAFTATMGARPRLITTYVDYRQTVANWPGNAGWQAWSNAQSVDGRTMRPVIGFPLASIAPGSAAPDAQFQDFAGGRNDGVIQGVVQAWVQHGFRHLIVRPGWEMNLQGPTYAGDGAQSQADWVAAYRHVYTVLHQAAAAAGATMMVVWNPSATNYTNAEATTNLYPGDAYVDAVGADFYAGMYPFMDSSQPPTFHDWGTGQEDTSVAQFIADPINRMHYWSWPAATRWSNDGSGGHSQSLASLLQFALLHHKSFAIPETGAGDSDAGTDVTDEAAFPIWLVQQLTWFQAIGGKVAFVSIWNCNGGGNYEFTAASDNKPLEAAAWASAFGAPP